MRIPDNISQALQTFFVARREPQMGLQNVVGNIQVDNQPVIEEPQGAPEPIRYSMFSGVGRAPTERWATVPVALHMNIENIQAVMSDNFLTGKVPVGQSALLTNGLGGQAAWTDRQNIDRGESNPYGNRVAVQGGASQGLFSAYNITYGGRRRV